MTKTKFIWIAFGVVILISIMVNAYKNFTNEKIIPKKRETINFVNKNVPTLVFDEREYYTMWTDEYNDKAIEISRILATNNIKGCGELYYNEIERSTYIIACSRDGITFNYYVVWTRINKVYSADRDMLSVNLPPK